VSSSKGSHRRSSLRLIFLLDVVHNFKHACRSQACTAEHTCSPVEDIQRHPAVRQGKVRDLVLMGESTDRGFELLLCAAGESSARLSARRCSPPEGGCTARGRLCPTSAPCPAHTADYFFYPAL